MHDQPIRVVVADDHELFREGLCRLLGASPEVDVVGEAADGQDAIKLVADLHPDIVLMDINMPHVDGLSATDYIVRHYPTTKVVVLTMYHDDAYLIQAIRAGAKSYLLKNSQAEEVLRAIEVTAGGGTLIDAGLAPALMREYQRVLQGHSSREVNFTERETTLLRLLADGCNNRQIAAQLDLAESTVKNNLSAVFQKIGVRDRTQAALYAIAQGFASQPAGPER